MSGSLRARSSNSAILRIASRMAPEGMVVEIFAGLDRLPFFNPDNDRELDDPTLPATVKRMRAALASADALVISSPEYAHGVSGMMKNALDWLVGGPEMVEKRVAVFNTSPHATHAHSALLETLRTMSAHVVDEACVSIALPRGRSDDDLASDAAVTAPLVAALGALG
ncbi:MAG: NAD(P)H-dependent oxidoreductase [Gemmatimonadaceae bacterium]